MLNPKKYNKILAWLDGAGIFEYESKITTARFYSEVTPIRSSSIMIADFNFIRDPFWIKKRDEFIEVKDTVLNEGTVYSEPIVRLEKGTSNKIDITINDVRFVYNFNNEPYVEIDFQKQTVEYDGLNRNRQIEIDYKVPRLVPGINKIIIHSGDAKVKIKRKDRWL